MLPITFSSSFISTTIHLFFVEVSTNFHLISQAYKFYISPFSSKFCPLSSYSTLSSTPQGRKRRNIIMGIPSKVYMRGGAGSKSDSSEHDPPNSAEDSGFEDWALGNNSDSDSASERAESEREESRDDGEEADVYEDDDRDYSL
jgi:hypothetical protein